MAVDELNTVDYLDRNNIGAARLKGLQTDLKLNATQYATCLSILYAGYILMQVPSNMIVNRISRPSIYIGIAVRQTWRLQERWLISDGDLGCYLHGHRHRHELRGHGRVQVLSWIR